MNPNSKMPKLEMQPEKLCQYMTREEAIKFMILARMNPLKYLCPNGKQEEYVDTVARAFDDDPIPIVKLAWANGVGKTSMTLHIMFNFILGPQNGWFDYDVFRSPPFPKVMLYDSTPKNLIRNVQPQINEIIGKVKDTRLYCDYDNSKIEEWLDLKAIDREDYKEGQQYISNMKVNDWTIFFNSYNQEANELEGPTIGVIVLDEPGPQSHWNALKSRVRMGGLMLLPMTPLDLPPYISDEINKAYDDGKTGYYNLDATVYDACQERGIRGHLPAKIVDKMVERYDPEEREARAFGKEMYFAGKIFNTLDPDIHFVDPDRYPIHQYARLVQILDPHDSRPSLVAWGAVNPDGRHIIFAEAPSDKSRSFWDMKRGQRTEEEVEDWINFEDEYKLTISRRIMDKRFGWQTRGQKTFAEEYMKEARKLKKKMIFEKSYTAGKNEDGEIKYGHRIVRKLLEPIDDGGPGLVIYRNCYHIWNGLTHYIRRRETGKMADNKIQAEAKIVEKYKDAADIVRYFVCADVVVKLPKKKLTHGERRHLEVTRRRKISRYT